MKNTNHFNIDTSELISDSVLQIKFCQTWSTDDVQAINEKLLAMFNAQALENIIGADICCTRVNFADYQLLLYLEEYSQSCWLEAASEQDIAGLIKIKQLLS